MFCDFPLPFPSNLGNSPRASIVTIGQSSSSVSRRPSLVPPCPICPLPVFILLSSTFIAENSAYFCVWHRARERANPAFFLPLHSLHIFVFLSLSLFGNSRNSTHPDSAIGRPASVGKLAMNPASFPFFIFRNFSAGQQGNSH